MAIVKAALELFSKYGYRRTSIDDVARAAGIAKGSVYLHFAGKRELFRAGCEAVLSEVLEHVEAARKKNGAVADRLFAVLDAKFGRVHELVGASPHATELLDTTSGLAADIVERTDKRFLDVLAEVLADAQKKREIDLGRIGLSAQQAAALVFRCAEGTAKDGSVTPKTYRKRLQQLVLVLLRGFSG